MVILCLLLVTEVLWGPRLYQELVRKHHHRVSYFYHLTLSRDKASYVLTESLRSLVQVLLLSLLVGFLVRDLWSGFSLILPLVSLWLSWTHYKTKVRSHKKIFFDLLMQFTFHLELSILSNMPVDHALAYAKDHSGLPLDQGHLGPFKQLKLLEDRTKLLEVGRLVMLIERTRAYEVAELEPLFYEVTTAMGKSLIAEASFQAGLLEEKMLLPMVLNIIALMGLLVYPFMLSMIGGM